LITSRFEQCFGTWSKPGGTLPTPGATAADCCEQFPPRLVAPETPPLRDAAAAAGPPLRQTRAPCERSENGPGRVPPSSAPRSSRTPRAELFPRNKYRGRQIARAWKLDGACERLRHSQRLQSCQSAPRLRLRLLRRNVVGLWLEQVS